MSRFLSFITTGSKVLLSSIFICGLAYTFFVGCALILEKVSREDRCSPLPEAFSEADLIGTWVAGVPKHRDTLILRGDGTYKQIIHLESAEWPTIDYESDWQPWHIERSENNITYLHLDGMRFCGMNPGISCDKQAGGGYDFCEDKSIQMLDEGTLIVLASSGDQSSNAESPTYYVHLHYPLGSQGSWSYDLQTP